MDRRQFLDHAAGALVASAISGQAGQASAQVRPSRPEVVLITGSSTGFGRRLALTYARAGYSVVATMREPRERNAGNRDALLESARTEGLRLRVEELDVTDSPQASAVVAGVLAREKRIDVLVNNAGIIVFTPSEIAPPELWDFQMRTNVYGPLDLTRIVLPSLRERGNGLVIMVSSRVGRVVIPGLGLYCASKFALETATEAMHYESTPQGVDFAIIQPSAFDTDVNRNARRIYANVTRPLIEERSPRGAAFHRSFLETLDRNFSGQPGRDPQEVADLALRITERPREERVLRYPVGDEREMGPVRTLNSQVATLQEGALREGGYGHLWRD